jgi:putative ABC transport system permease protein
VLTAQVLVPRTKYPEGPQISSLYDQLLTRVRTLPDVESAALVSILPLSGSSNFLSFNIEGRPQPRPEEVIDATVVAVAPGYFSTMGIGVVRGEEFSGREAPDSPRVVMINEALQRRYFATEDPIGRRVTVDNGPDKKPLCLTIVGIVRDIHSLTLSETAYPHMFVPYAQRPSRVMSFVVRTKHDPFAVVGALKSEVRAVDRDLPLSRIAPLTTVLANSVSQPRAYMILVLLFAVVGLLLSAIGIYGVFSYSVTQRTGEFGVRLALGASSSDVLRMVLSDGMKLTVIESGSPRGTGAFAVDIAVLYGVRC